MAYYKISKEKVGIKTPSWTVVVAQLVLWLLPTPEIRGLNPVIGKFLFRTFVYRLSFVLKIRK